MWRRPGESISPTHLSHTALSAGIEAPVPEPSEWMIEKPLGPSYGKSSLSTDSICARGGRSDIRAAISSSGLSVSMTTMDPPLRTVPDAPHAAAALKTAGLNPTPWTVPRTTILMSRSSGSTIKAIWVPPPTLKERVLIGCAWKSWR